ncbi:hypothetical protein DAH66_22050 [Sphingomonas koreensis]|uniref:Uncharacterized protein n=2 Tax=Sphingomonas koreensis TaxID=93064 RepID=A0A430FX99_9SPHN|nr:hypothetical protein DAH66_22050 [Sphingomonas koreensis]
MAPDKERGEVMKSYLDGKKLLLGGALGGLVLVSVMAVEGLAGGREPGTVANEPVPEQQAFMQVNTSGPGQQDQQGQQGRPVDDTTGQGGAQQALVALMQIRKQQCQMGNQLACQVLPQMSGYQQQLGQLEQGCRRGDRNACDGHASLARRITVAYNESAAVMQQGEAGMAQMNAWRAQMNQNAANSMANLQARGAAGQAAHNARQEANAAMNRSWESGQASAERTQGRFVDGIYGGTTMDGGGVQSRIPYGSRGYTDGRGNVIAVPEGGRAPDGWQAMDPTYAAPR